MLLLWVPILLASVSALPLSQVSSSPRHICDFEDAFRSKLHHGWTFAAAPTFTQRTRRIGHAFRFSSSRIIYLSRMFLFLHKVHSKKQRVLSSTNMDLLLRDDAYGQCELYGSHLVQVIHFHWHRRCSCSHITHFCHNINDSPKIEYFRLTILLRTFVC